MNAMIEFIGAIGLILTGYLAMRGFIEASGSAPQAVPVRVASRRSARQRP
ncbi:hypothetical protein AB4097_20095 [Microvirga sp. 2MCAF35]